jgi:hypothetical protein
MAVASTLDRHVDELREATGLAIDLLQEPGRVGVALRQVPLPAGLFRIATTDVLFLTDEQYPLSALDMFWTDLEVVRPDGSIPQGAEAIEAYFGREWRRFSWHRGGPWVPTGNKLLEHYAVMERRWAVEPR